MKQQISHKRLDYIDALRGFALLAIVYGHASRDVGLLAKAVYSFHVPLCIFITGCLYEFKDSSLGTHVKTSFQKLLIPYFFWSLVSMAIYLLLGNLAAGALGSEVYSLSFNVKFMLKGLSIGNAPLWYLPFLFSTLLLMFLWGKLLRLLKVDTPLKKALVFLTPFLFSFVSLFLYSRVGETFYLPFGLSNACFLFVFLWAGFGIRKAVSLPEGKKWAVLGGILAVLSILSALIFNDEVEYMSFDHSVYGRNIMVFYGSALLTCFSLLLLFRNLPCRLLSFFGKHAMGIFVMHKFPVLFFQVILGDLPQKAGPFRFLCFLLISLVSMGLCCGVTAFLRRFLPFTLGEKKHK